LSAITVRPWSEDEFATGQTLWSELLVRSDANPLFMSWDWQWRWWEHHRGALGGRLHVLAVHTEEGELIGLAPFYSRTTRVGGVIPITRLEFLGSAWRDDRAAFSEYLDLIVDRARISDAAGAIVDWLRAARFWQDAVFACVRSSSVAARLATEQLSALAHVREADPFEAHCIALPASAAVYARGLSPAVRRKTYGQRRRIEPVSVSPVTESTLEAAFQRLDAYTARRWTRQVLSTPSRRFRADFAQAMARRQALQMTELASAGDPQSVMYNVRLGSTEYYLQSGFNLERSRGVSLGYLHFGYAIELACAAGVQRLDLLGGVGLHRDYKRDFGTQRERLASLHIIRSPWLRALYALHRKLMMF
jgi:hypothetical protein